MGVLEMVKAYLIVPRSELPKVATELSSFDMFHACEEGGVPSDPVVDDLALRAYRLFIDLDELMKGLKVKAEVSIIETLTKGYSVEKETFKARDWADFVARLEADAKPTVEELKSLVEEKSQIAKQMAEGQALREAFSIISRFSIDLATLRSLRRFYIVFSVAKTKDVGEVRRSLPEDIVVSSPLVEGQSAILIATVKADSERVDKVLRSFEVKQFEIPERLPQNPAEALRIIEQELEQQRSRILGLERMLEDTLKRSERRLVTYREAAETAYTVLTRAKKAGELKRFAVVEGYLPSSRLAEFEERFSRWILFTERAGHAEHNMEEAATTPTYMKNPRFINAFENITLNQGPPKYGELDPTPIITLTFPIFYGIMFGDLGQGSVLALFGLLLYIRGYDSLKQWGIMLAVAGTAAATMGFIIGEAFGLPVAGLIPGLEHPLIELVERAGGESGHTEGVMTILQVAILVGIAHLTIGFGLDAYKALREREYLEAYTVKIPTFVMYLAGIVFSLGFIGAGNSFSGLLEKQDPIPLIGIPVAHATLISLPVILVTVMVLVFGKPVAIVLGRAPKESVAMSAVMGVVEFLLRVVEFLANTVSYARLGILLLVHIALLMVLNRALELPLGVALPMLIVFNILIMLLEGLIVYIQDLRLHLYEWFTKFYEGSGIIFRRIQPKTTYVDIEWEKGP